MPINDQKAMTEFLDKLRNVGEIVAFQLGITFCGIRTDTIDIEMRITWEFAHNQRVFRVTVITPPSIDFLGWSNLEQHTRVKAAEELRYTHTYYWKGDE